MAFSLGTKAHRKIGTCTTLSNYCSNNLSYSQIDAVGRYCKEPAAFKSKLNFSFRYVQAVRGTVVSEITSKDPGLGSSLSPGLLKHCEYFGVPALCHRDQQQLEVSLTFCGKKEQPIKFRVGFDWNRDGERKLKRTFCCWSRFFLVFVRLDETLVRWVGGAKPFGRWSNNRHFLRIG